MAKNTLRNAAIAVGLIAVAAPTYSAILVEGVHLLTGAPVAWTDSDEARLKSIAAPRP